MKLFTSKEIKPEGWLLRQLKIQADGLSGNLDRVWPDVANSKWIGGDSEGWERVPYWLDGFVPLAYLIGDDDMIARAKKYIDAIISKQCADGWICPCTDEERPEYDTWAIQLISKVLVVYYECSADERIPDVVYRVMKNYYDLLSSGRITLFKWGKYRWFETFIALGFLAERGEEDWMRSLAHILDEQGYDYREAEQSWHRPLNRWTYTTHVVNMAMMLKYGAITDRLLDRKYRGVSDELYDILMKYNGTPVGIFTGDECLAGLSPVHGTELCAVAELMYSAELLFAHTGDKKWAEILERVAFNAMPATVSDDMWTHQYDQLSNQICCERFPGKSLFRTNGPESHLFGLEPNYGCCTANFNQAFPKLALSALMREGDDIISVTPLPCHLRTDSIDLRVETDYPFLGKIKYSVAPGRAFTLRVRVPEGAEELHLCGKPIATSDFIHLPVAEGEACEFTLEFTRHAYLDERPHNLKCVRYGSLVFSLPIKIEKRIREYEKNGVVRKFPYCDYEYIGKSEWRYGFASDKFELIEGKVGDIPFSGENPPLRLLASLAPVEWDYEDGYDTVAAKTPVSDVAVGEPVTLELYPYGCAKLRMTEMPLCTTV